MIYVQSQNEKDIFKLFNFLLQEGCMQFDVKKLI